MNAPEYEPNRGSGGAPQFKVGEIVRFRRMDGKSQVGRIVERTMGGNYDIKDDNGREFRKSASDIELVSDDSPSIPVADAQSAMLQQASQAEQSQPADDGGSLASQSEPAAPSSDSPSPNKNPQALPPVPKDHHRFWHGGDEYKGGARFFSPDYDYAKGYADKSGGNVHYLDVPGDSPHLKKTFDDSGTSAKAPYASFEAPESLAKNMSQVGGNHAGREPIKPPVQSDSQGGNPLDNVQTALDGVGVVGDAVVPGSGVAADGMNVVVSLLRAATERKNAGGHLKNAGISAVSMLPFVGDLAKGLKLGGGRGGNGDGEPPEAASGGEEASEDPLYSRSATVRDKIVSFTTAVGTASAAVIVSANAMSLLNKATIEYHRDLVKYNGEISEAYGKLETDRMERSIREGGELSGSLSGLVESQSRLEDKLQDFQSPWKVIGADVVKILTELLAIGVAIVDFIEPISEIYVDYIRPLLVKMGVFKSGTAQAASTGWFDKIQKRSEENSKKPRKV